MAVTHTYVSAIADAGDASVVQPSDWNADHTVADNSFVAAKLSATATDKLFGRSTAGGGAGEEIACTSAARSILDDASVGAIATTLGLGTGDSPQFTAVNIGHATENTITRTGAGDIAIEGKGIYRADGTDVAVADGGTGASTAAAARTNLSVLLKTLFAGYVSGGQINYVGSGEIQVEEIDFHVEGLDEIVHLDTTNKASLTGLSASTFYYIYLYAPDTSTTPTIVVSTTAPAAPYHGRARSSSGTISGNAANLHRFVGVFRSNGAGTPVIIPFIQYENGIYQYMMKCSPAGTVFARMLQAGSAQTKTAVDLSSVMPPQSTIAVLNIVNAGTPELIVGPTGFGLDYSSIMSRDGLGASVAAVDLCPTDTSQSVDYMNSGAGGAAYIEVLGFVLPR